MFCINMFSLYLYIVCVYSYNTENAEHVFLLEIVHI